MCKFLSCIYTLKDGIVGKDIAWQIDSHQDQIELLGLQNTDHVKVEITPPERMEDFFKPDLWSFRIDQDIKPNWCCEKTIEYETRQYLKSLLDECLYIPKGTTTKIIHGIVLAIKGSGVIHRLSNLTTIRFLPGKTTIKDAGWSTIENAGDSTIENAGWSTIKDAGRSTIENAGRSTINHAGRSTIENAGWSTIKHAGYSTIKDAGRSTIKDAGDSTIEHAGWSTIKGIKYRNGKPEDDDE